MNAVLAETPQNAARRLAVQAFREGFQLAALHSYYHANGEPYYWRIRAKHPDGRKWIRPMHWDGTKYVIGEPAAPATGKPLYRLPDLLARPEATVWIVEGESCADALTKLGMAATTSGSADSAAAADWTPLHGRRVRLWPDKDAAGAKYADLVASIVLANGCGVERVDVEALPLANKGDCVDWLAQHPGATREDVEALPITLAEARDKPDQGPRVILRRGSDVEPVRVAWLWPGWLAAGKLHLVGGAPGTGKTTIAATLAAAVTIGGRWPDGSHAPAGDVVIWSGEDDNADTLNPRLRAAGANMRRVHVVEAVIDAEGKSPFDPSRDLDLLRAALLNLPDVRLIVVDPVVSAVSGDSHKNAEVRRGLQPLVDLAGEFRAALLGVTHFSKGTAGRDPVERVTGSLAFAALARLVMVTAKQEADGDRPERRVILRAKSNIGPDGGGFVYDLIQGDLEGFPGVTASRVLWGEPVTGSARELLAEAETAAEDEGDRRDAASWLRETLSAGEMPVKDLRRHADDAGFAWRTVQRAMREVGVDSKRAGFGQPALWKLRSRATSQAVAPFAPHSGTGATGANGELEVVEL